MSEEADAAGSVTAILKRADPAWSGWVLREKYLVSPEGWEFTFGEIRALPFMHAQIRTYQRLQRTIQQADWIEQRFIEVRETDTA